MGVKVTNNAFGTLSAAINTSATTITLDSGQGARFPTLGASDYFFGTLVDTSNNLEIVKVTARSSDSLTVVRGQDGTTATAFAIGDRFELRPVAALFEDIISGASVDGITSASASGTAMSITSGNDVAFDTDTLFVDATNNHVGFGTATPANPIDATLAAGADFVARFQNTTAATPYNVWVKDASSGADGYPLLQVTDNAGTGTYFRVDSGTGRVYMPKNPSFYARGSGGWYTVSNGSNTQIPLTVTNHNTGSHYDTSTSTFTAPSGGRYMFALGTYGRIQGGQGDNTRYWFSGFLKNNAVVNSNSIVGYQNDGDYDFGYTQTIVVELAANDTMKVYARSAGSYNGEVYRANCFFCGHHLS